LCLETLVCVGRELTLELPLDANVCGSHFLAFSLLDLQKGGNFAKWAEIKLDLAAAARSHSGRTYVLGTRAPGRQALRIRGELFMGRNPTPRSE
jgi:hypothetical protein